MNKKFVSGVDTGCIKRRIKKVEKVGRLTKFPELVLYVIFGFQLKFERFEARLRMKNKWEAQGWYNTLIHERRVSIMPFCLEEEKVIICLSGAMHLI